MRNSRLLSNRPVVRIAGAHATENYALGRTLFLQMLKDTEGLDVSLEQLRHIGREDLDRNLRALRVACTSFAAEKPIQECIARHRPTNRAGEPYNPTPGE